MHYVLLSCYVLIPPRRALDYTVFKIRNFDDSEKSKDNYMVINNRKGYFVFNSYKNSSRLGSQKIAIPNDLKNIILRWTKINDKDWLILSSRREKIQMNKINAMMQEIFKRKLGPSLLRHSFLTHVYGNINLKDMNATADAMGSNDIKTQLRYVDKSIAKEERGE
jgi:integrase